MSSGVERPGVFIVFEGGEGVGKSTVVRYLSDYLRSCGNKVILTREPGGTDLAEELREIILRDESSGISALQELFLFSAAREDHLRKVVKPALDEGYVVLCDRFIGSTYVYQGIVGGVDLDFLVETQKPFLDIVSISRTYVLDLDVDIALSRVSTDGVRDVNRIDLAGKEFHERIRRGYKNFASGDSGKLFNATLVDASPSPDIIVRNIVSDLVEVEGVLV